jgi:hypothetical protein
VLAGLTVLSVGTALTYDLGTALIVIGGVLTLVGLGALARRAS